MTDEEKIALKAACVQAAATLKAARHMRAGEPTDPVDFAKFAADLYASVIAIKWGFPATEGEAITRGREDILGPPHSAGETADAAKRDTRRAPRSRPRRAR